MLVTFTGQWLVVMVGLATLVRMIVYGCELEPLLSTVWLL